MSKTALITGITGQDGSYLAELLISKGYLVRGMLRRASHPSTNRLNALLNKYPDDNNPNNPFILEYGDMTDSTSIRNVIERFKPDEIYNLAAQSHVGISFNNPESTININTLGTLRILEAIRNMKLPCKFYQASSSEMFGTSNPPQDETTPFIPQSPYGISKVAAFYLTRLYRNAYGIFASNGILFNHESPRRGLNFVTRKITLELAQILVGEKDKLVLGNLDAKRDWGFSKEYVEAMWLILQHDKPDDFVIATEETHSIRDFLEEVFNLIGLNYENFIEINDRYKRASEVPHLLGNATKARNIIKWESKTKFKELARMMLVADLKSKFEEIGILPVGKRSDEFYLNKARKLALKLKVEEKHEKN